MAPSKPLFCAASLLLLTAVTAAAAPAYVPSTVNLRAGAGTGNEIVAKIPGGSLVDATNCTDWCEVDWQGKKGFAIATALDRSGRAPQPPRRTAGPPPQRIAAGGPVIEDGYVPVGPPVGVPVGAPVVVYRPYPFGPRPYWGRRWCFGFGCWRW